MASKKRITVELGIEKSSLSQINGVLKDIKTNFQDSLDFKKTAGLKNLEDSLDRINRAFKDIGDEEVGEDLFKNMNKQVLEVTKEFGSFLKLLSKDISINIDSKALDEVDNKLKTSEKRLDTTIEKMKKLSSSQTEGGIANTGRDYFQTEMKAKIPGFDGKSESIGMGNLIRKDITHVQAYINALNALDAKYESISKKKDRSAKEDSFISEYNQTKETRKALKESIAIANQKVLEDKKHYSELEKIRDKELKDTEAFLKEKTRLLAEGGDKNSGLLSNAQGQIHTEQNKLKNSKNDFELEKSRKKDEAFGAESLFESSKTSANGMDEVIGKLFTLQVAFKLTKEAIQKTLEVIGELDAAFVNIAVVTQYTNKQVWGMYESFSGIAKSAGFSVAEVAGVAGEYFRQGESLTNVLKLTEAAAKAAKVAGIDASESVRYLTSAVRGYNLAADEAMNVSDKFAAVAASSATSYDGLATAMSKVAAQAYANGVEMDNLMGMMATAMDVTQEAPENIGTAFKTILARMSEIKDYGKVLEDGVSANKVEEALATVNIALFDQNKEMKALDGVLLELGSKWHTLNKSQKAYLATTLAGTRQQTRLLAVLENYDKTLKNIETSANSAGATEAQQAKNTESIAHNLMRIQIAFEGITKALVGNKVVLGGVKIFAASIEGVASLSETLIGKVIALTAAATAFHKVILMIGETQTFKKLFSYFKKSNTAIGAYFKNIEKGQGVAAALKSAYNMSLTSITGMFGKMKGAATSAFAAVANNPALIGMALLAVAVAKVAHEIYKASKKVENLKKEVKELSIEAYNLGQSQKTLKDLGEEYTKLSKKVIKTTEDMARMREIAQLASDTDTEGEYNFQTSDGLLNTNMMDKALSDMDEKVKRNFQDQAEANAALIDSFDDLETRVEKFNAAEGFVIKTHFELDKEAWDKLSDDYKTELVNLYQNLTEGGRYIDSSGSRTTKSKSYESDPDNLDGNSWVKNEEIIFDAEAVKRAQEYKESVVEAETSLKSYQETIRELTGDMYALIVESDPFLNSLAELGELSTTSIAEVRELTQALDIVETYGVEVGEKTRKNLIQMYDTQGIDAFTQSLSRLISYSEVGAGSIAKISLSLVEAFDKLSLDGLLDNMQEFDSVIDRIDKLNQSLNNLSTDSIRELLAMVERYPELADDMIASIELTGQISEEVTNNMLQAEVHKTKESIRNEIEQNKARIKILELQQGIVEAMIEDEVAINKLAADAKADISDTSFENILSNVNSMTTAYADAFKEMINLANKTSVEMDKALTSGTGNAGSLQATPLFGKKEHKTNSAEFKARQDAILASLKSGLQSTKKEITGLENINKVLEMSYNKVGTEAWKAGNKAAKGAEKAGKAAKEAAANVEIYLGALNKLYVAQKKLEIVDWGIGKIEAGRTHADSYDSVKGMSGAQNSQYVSDSGAGTEDLYSAYDLRKRQLKELIEVNQDYIRMHEGKLDPALKGTYKIINNQVYPVSAKYKNLTGVQMKELDEFAKTVNELGANMNNYTKEVMAAEQAQNELLASMRDTVIEYQELLIDAIKNEEKKHLESFKKIIDANKKYLEERKRLYEKSFKDQDNEKTSGDLEVERLKLIEKLAALEAAHDITSLQQKEKYREELANLDEQYNNLTLERNREAYLESIDNQINYQDEIYQKEEEAYNARISSGIWLEERLKQVQDEARLQAIMDNDLHNMTIQQMLDNGYITQNEITRLGLTDMSVTMNQLSNEQQNMLMKYWTENRNIIDKMWNATEGKVGAVKLSQDAMNNIIKYLTAHSTQMEGKTKLMQEKTVAEWRKMMQKVYQYTNDFNAITLKGPNIKPVTNQMSNLIWSVDNASKTVQNEYQRMIDKMNAAASAAERTASRINSANSSIKPPSSAGSSSVSSGSSGKIANEHGVFESAAAYQKWLKNNKTGKNPNNLAPMATGGTTERTGIHWLDGKPGAPERVLSPGQNKAFEGLLTELTQNNKSGYSDSEIVEALLELGYVFANSNEASAEAIVRGLSGNSSVLSLGQHAKRLGISTNKKG